MNLREWAVIQGVSYSTVLRWHKGGVLLVPTCQVGRLVVIGDGAVPGMSGATVVFAGVSSAGQRRGLDRAVCRVATWARGQRDVTEFLTGLCARLYGRRAAADRVARMVGCATVAHCPDGAW
jgi:predicted site-specific integrase-resolvase